MNTCPTCTESAGDNFGGMCDPCHERWAARTQRARGILVAAGHANTDLGRALRVDRLTERD